MTRHAGIDPGKAGAAAVVEGDTVVWHCRWRVQPAGHVLLYLGDEAGERRRLSSVGHLAREVAWHLVHLGMAAVLVEDQHVQKPMGLRSILSLAHDAGAMAGACQADGMEVVWMTGRSWRPAVGISQSAQRADVKRWAVDLVRQRAGIEVTGDEAEAVCMAWALAAR